MFSVQGLTGWEAAAPLAEESRDPRKNVPRALVWSIVLLGIFLVLMYWGQIIGYGVKNLSGLTNATVLPGITLARKYWGGGYVVILIAFFNSVLAVCLATANVGTRMWYRMGQSGTLPPTFAVVHPKYKTPTTAILVQLALSLATGIGVGLWLGASNSYFLIDGLILVIACVVIYIMGNLACFMLYWRTRREHFNVFMHLIFPIISSAALIYALIKSFPVSYPFNLAPWIDGVWLVIGIGVLVYFKMRGNETWLLKAGRALGEEDEPSLDDARPAEASRTPREGQ